LPILFVVAFLLRRWKSVSNLSLVAAVVLFVLLLAEFSYRCFFKSAEPVSVAECGNDCYQHDTLLGFKPAVPGQWKMLTILPGNDTIVNTKYTIIKDTLDGRVVYDHRIGYRNDSGSKEVVFLGCSFTFGSNIADSATLAYQYGKLVNISTINLGCAAYGLHQVYGVYRSRYEGQYNRNRVFVYSLLSDHFFRGAGVYDWNLDGPYFRHENDSLIYEGPLNRNINMRYRRAPHYLSFFGSLHLLKDKLEDITLRKRMKAFGMQDYDRIQFMLWHMARSISATGGKLVILNWDRSNWGYQGYEFPFQQNLDKDVFAMQQHGAVVLRVSDIINYGDTSNFIRSDGHPTALANLRIAKALANKFP
jgi:hypothetical protein